MSWSARRLAAFDLETTGLEPASDRIVTAAVSLVGDGLPTEHRSWLVDPGVDIPPDATAVHGITTAAARTGGMAPARAIDAIAGLLAAQVSAGVPIVAFNARFDLTLLDREARRHGVRSLAERVGGPDQLVVIDPSVLDRHHDTTRIGPRSLAAVCAHYGVELATPHAAAADALAAARVAVRVAERFPAVAGADLRVLHRRQVTWAAEQAAALEAAHRAEGILDPIPRAWPIVPDAVTPALAA
ncbi:DNA polymerase exonuclease subunit [Paraconexibacter sp. AEG42_29]|uniref:DNA polymerase exonuclease subunit n=1 Tax=Paraconexibacter sp. AEG42_29 TaxID=2997339 RepID=A0AAU7B217_9ACTN